MGAETLKFPNKGSGLRRWLTVPSILLLTTAPHLPAWCLLELRLLPQSTA